MTLHSRSRRTTLVLRAALLLGSLGCADDARVAVPPTAPLFGRVASTGPAVTAATPPYGDQGQVGERVTITGSGFAPGAVASWQRNGDSTKVHVTNTQYVSSTQLIATIDIAPDADLAFYDVAVTNSDRKKGIGTELFEVTTAVSLGSLGGNTNANAV